MKLSNQPYKGTRDFFPPEKRVHDYIFSKMRETAHLYGYEAYDGPLLEEVDLYKAKSGEELINEQIYSFYDRGERFVAIRPEMTPTLARMVSRIHKEQSKPLRWYSIPNLMRYEKPQKGRLREHWQFNCDIFGAPSSTGEIEIVQLAITLMKNFGATENDFEILLNDRGIVDAIFTKQMNLESEKSHRLYKVLDKSKKVESLSFKKMVTELTLDARQEELFWNYYGCDSFEKIITLLNAIGEIDAVKNITSFADHAKHLEIDKFIKYDPSIVRGLDYYTGIVFEIFDKHPENARAICGGGSYANLLKIFGEDPLPGVGFGLGDVTLTDFLVTHNLMPDFSSPETEVYITFQTDDGLKFALNFATKLRAEKIKCVVNLEPIKVKKLFSVAEKKGARFVTMIGTDEMASNTIQIKNMSTKEQHNISTLNIAELVRILK